MTSVDGDPKPEASEDESPEADGDTSQDEGPVWPKVLIFSAGTLAVLLIGATIGMLLTVARDGGSEPEPGADSVAVGFAQDMSVHHLQAVTMGNIARDRSRDPRIRQLAFDIASTQLEQVGRMKGWLMLWGQPEQALGEYMTWMPDAAHGHSHGGTSPSPSPSATGGAPMPGMATDEEMSRLRTLSGRQLDVYFLQLMLRHHQGGVDMATYARDHARLHAVRTLASSMLKSQGPEMTLMKQLLAERNAKPLPYP